MFLCLFLCVCVMQMFFVFFFIEKIQNSENYCLECSQDYSACSKNMLKEQQAATDVPACD